MATTDDTMTIGERYSLSINSSNLRDEARIDRPSQTDTLKAMAWTEAKIGAQLSRLMFEYDGIEKPKPLSHNEKVRLALTMHSDAKEPKDRVKEKEIKAQIEADKWMRSEKALFISKLKTLPAAIEAVGVLCEKARIQNPRKVAVNLINYWLDQLCKVCHGLTATVMLNAPTLSAKSCFKCGGSGLAHVPHGESGKKIVNNMDRLVAMAHLQASYLCKHG